MPGFGVRVSPSGNKSFVLMYRCNVRSRRMTLGRYPLISLAAARRQAVIVLGDVARGVDPHESAGNEARFDETVDLFVRKYCAQHNRDSTRHETERLLKARFVSQWGGRAVKDVTTCDILSILDKAIEDGLPSAANHALATIRFFFNWCVDRGLVQSNPCGRLKMPGKKKARDRVLSDDELARIWVAAGLMGYPFGTSGAAKWRGCGGAIWTSPKQYGPCQQTSPRTAWLTSCPWCRPWSPFFGIFLGSTKNSCFRPARKTAEPCLDFRDRKSA